MLRQAVPYHKSSATGVKLPVEVGSGEVLVDSFKEKFVTPPDPTQGRNKPIVSYLDNVTALLNFDELASLMNRIMRQGNTIETVLQSIYDCQTSIGTASRTHGEVEALNPYGSMLTTSQPSRIADLVKKEQVSSGFANRIIYVFGQEKRQSAFTPTLPPLRHLSDRLKDIAAWAQKVRNTLHYIEWDDDAKARYEQFHYSIVNPTIQSDPNRDLINRMSLSMKKHVLWLCMDVQAPRVTIDIVERAILFWDYLYASYKAVAGHMMTTELGEKEEEVLSAIQRSFDTKGKWPTKSELRRNHLNPAKWPRQELDLMLKNLMMNGHVAGMPPEPGKGNRQERISIPSE
jgi:hypothetical protein